MQPTGAFLGAATLDLHYLVAEYPGPNEQGPAERFGLYAGGPAANAAVAFAHLGGSARLYAEVGCHPLGRMIAADLHRHGVELVDMAPTTETPPMVSAIVTTAGTGDRMVVASHYPDAGATEQLPGALPRGCDILLVDGFLRRACRDALDRAAEHAVTTVIDAGSWRPGIERLLPRIDVAICSADFHPPGTSTPGEAIADLQRRGVPRVAVTRGCDPVLFSDGEQIGEVPIARVPVVDTLGAGDVLHGAFCYHLATGADFPDGLAAAAAVATRSVQSFGTRAWMTENGTA